MSGCKITANELSLLCALAEAEGFIDGLRAVNDIKQVRHSIYGDMISMFIDQLSDTNDD